MFEKTPCPSSMFKHPLCRVCFTKILFSYESTETISVVEVRARETLWCLSCARCSVSRVSRDCLAYSLGTKQPMTLLCVSMHRAGHPQARGPRTPKNPTRGGFLNPPPFLKPPIFAANVPFLVIRGGARSFWPKIVGVSWR